MFDSFQYRYRRYGAEISLIILDLDDFKKVNDKKGHLTGDRLLIGLSEKISGTIRPTDLLARWGGDEFIILMEAPLDDCKATAERIGSLCREGIGNGFDVFNGVTLSIGVTGYRESDTLETMIQRADKALYKAKELGKDRVISIP